MALVKGLPSNAATRDGWGTTEELLASLLETVDFGNRVLAATVGMTSEPLLVYRPGADQDPAPHPKSTLAEVKGFFRG